MTASGEHKANLIGDYSACICFSIINFTFLPNSVLASFFFTHTIRIQHPHGSSTSDNFVNSRSRVFKPSRSSLYMKTSFPDCSISYLPCSDFHGLTISSFHPFQSSISVRWSSPAFGLQEANHFSQFNRSLVFSVTWFWRDTKSSKWTALGTMWKRLRSNTRRHSDRTFFQVEGEATVRLCVRQWCARGIRVFT